MSLGEKMFTLIYSANTYTGFLIRWCRTIMDHILVGSIKFSFQKEESILIKD